jgi:hypothetical protein
MNYELSEPALVFSLAERRGRYRKARRQRHLPARKHRDVPTEPSERSARDKFGGARWRRILELSQRLSKELSDDARKTWLALEEAVNGHWLDVAMDHYDRGFAAGRARSLSESQIGSRATRQQRLRALVDALSSVVDELDGASDD